MNVAWEEGRVERKEREEEEEKRKIGGPRSGLNNAA